MITEWFTREIAKRMFQSANVWDGTFYISLGTAVITDLEDSYDATIADMEELDITGYVRKTATVTVDGTDPKVKFACSSWTNTEEEPWRVKNVFIQFVPTVGSSKLCFALPCSYTINEDDTFSFLDGGIYLEAKLRQAGANGG